MRCGIQCCVKYRSRKTRIRRRIAACVCAVLLLVLAGWMYRNATRMLVSVAEEKLRAMANVAVNEAVYITLADGVRYEDLISIERDASGEIGAIVANALHVNAIARDTASFAQMRLTQMSGEGIDVPLGAFTGIGLFAGLGPSIRLKTLPVVGVNTRFCSEFVQAGINQTRHSIYLEVVTDISIVLPGQTGRFAQTTQVLIAESVLVGEVPDSYFQADLFGGTSAAVRDIRSPK